MFDGTHDGVETITESGIVAIWLLAAVDGTADEATMTIDGDPEMVSNYDDDKDLR